MSQKVEWRLNETGELTAFIDGTPAIWFPQPGSQEAFLRCPIFETLLAGNRGGGKALSNGERILSDSGWKQVGDVVMADKLVAIDGTFTEILGIFPQGKKELYRLTFCDGVEIIVDAEHLWEVRSQKACKDEPNQIKTTKEIVESTQVWSIPVIEKPVPGKKWIGPDPYILGLILGDGTLTGDHITIYNTEPEIIEYLKAAGWKGNRYKKKSPKLWQMYLYGDPQYKDILGRVSKEDKHVPQELLEADPHTRLRLLQGMMDADGSCDREGRITACTISERMANDYVYLIRSLGGLAQKHYSAPRSLKNKSKKLSGVKSEWSKPIWRVNISHRNVLKPFTLKRKLSKMTVTHKYQYRAIKSIEPCGTGDATCFAVKHPRKLFVIDGFVVTHNTDVLLMDFAQYVGRGFGEEWKGILFRRTFPELDDIISKSLKWFKKIWPDADYNKQAKTWTWATGETLKFRHIMRPSEYWNYHGHCLKNGDVLTPTGWRDIKNIKVGDIVYAVDENRDLIPMPVATKTEEDYDGDLVVHEGRGSFMEFTPNHKVAVVQDDGTLKPTKYNSLGHEVIIAANVNYRGGAHVEQVDIPQALRNPRYTTKYKNQPLTVTGDDFAEFMGWFLSEGSTVTSNLQVGVGQQKKKNRTWIADLLLRMGIEFGSNKTGFIFSSIDWWTYLRPFGKCRDKFVPEIIKNMNARQLRLFFNAAMAGDGSWQKDNAYYFTTSKQLADDMAEIAVKLGYKVYVSSRQRDSREGLSYTITCRGSKRRDIKLRTDVRWKRGKPLSAKIQVQREHHKGKVYCIGLEKHHMFVIRQQGSVWVSGNSYPWIGFEELTTWPNSECYTPLFSLCRSAHPQVAKLCRVRATTNPYGPGHNWVKKRFKLPMADGMLLGTVIRDTRDVPADELDKPRVAIRSSLAENKILLLADPSYVNTLRAAARNPAELAAWIEGSWDITSGGMFDDIWNEKIHVIPNIPYILLRKSGWFMNRAYDHGLSKPFSVGWWAESNGNPITLFNKEYGQVKGDIFLFDEYYGCANEDNKGLNMTAQAIARQIKEKEKEMGLRGRIKRGPADSSIFSKYDGLKTVAGDMKKEGVYWDDVDKSKGSRVQGWQQIRTLLSGSIPVAGVRENKGLFICERCTDSRRTVPCLPRDDKNLDDVNSDVEDHAGDMWRYRFRWTRRTIIQRTW